jgi:RND family efflux transporter MFP subunit
MPKEEYSNKLDPETSSRSPVRKRLGSMGRLLLGLIIFAAGAGISIYWLTNQPKAQRRPPKAQATLVEVSPVQTQTEKVVVRAMGPVVPVRSIQLASRVSGQIVEVSPQFIPGGHFKAGEKILQVEQKDYRLAVEQRKSELVKAQRDLKLEMGQQSVAQREYELLAQDVEEEDMELLLRQPQLEMTKAAVSAAEAVLEKAQLDLERTEIVAPFNTIVQSKNVDLGSHVSSGTVLASLVETDEYWVEVSTPVDELKWISIPGYNEKSGSAVRVYYESAWGKDAFRFGTVERLMTDLEPQGRMARLLIDVNDPLQLQANPGKRHPLILGSYVRVEIEGIEVPDIVKIPRTAVREANQVWVMSPDEKLEIRTVSIVWSGNDHVYVSDGLDDGDLLIMSSLGAPVQGMPLRTTDSSPPSPERRDESAPLRQTESQP